MNDKDIKDLAGKLKDLVDNNIEFKEMINIPVILAKTILDERVDNLLNLFLTCDDETILSFLLEIETDIDEETRLTIEKYDLLKYYYQDEKSENEEVEEKENDIFSTLDENDSVDKKFNRQRRYRVNMPIHLNKTKIYVSASSEKEFGALTGTFYIFNNAIINGKIKISKTKSSKPLGWVNLDDITIIGVNK